MPIPDSLNFTLQDVVNEINPSSNTLRTCFDESDPALFDSNYVPSGFDPHATNKTGYRLSYFRNYNAASITVDPSEYNTDCQYQTYYITVEATHDWTMTEKEDWVKSVYPTTGSAGSTSVSVELYSTPSTPYSRSGSIKFELDSYSEHVYHNITQSCY
jgi:hypothetical protein